MADAAPSRVPAGVMTADAYFRWLGKNILTPNLIATRETPTRFVELSWGVGIDGEPIYGVTVVFRDRFDRSGLLERDDALSELFRDRKLAEERFKSAP